MFYIVLETILFHTLETQLKQLNIEAEYVGESSNGIPKYSYVGTKENLILFLAKNYGQTSSFFNKYAYEI